MTRKDRYAVWGNPITHSLSPHIHNTFATLTNQTLIYEKKCGSLVNFEQEITQFFKDGAKGCNITAPFKQRAFALATIHSERALQAKSCNTLKILENGKLYADNTDGWGLIMDLQRLNWLKPAQNVLILGAGGATQSVLDALLKAKQHIFLANRDIEKAQALVEACKELGNLQAIKLQDIPQHGYQLCINATSLGLNGEDFTLLDQWACQIPHFYDMQYRLNADTPFLAKVKSFATNAGVDGLGMLIAQGAESFKLWRGVTVDWLRVLNSFRK